MDIYITELQWKVKNSCHRTKVVPLGTRELGLNSNCCQLRTVHFISHFEWMYHKPIKMAKLC